MGSWLLVLASWLAGLGCAKLLIDRSDSRWIDWSVVVLVAVFPIWLFVSAIPQFEQCSMKWLIGEATSVKLMLLTLIASSMLHFVLLIGVSEGRLIATAFAVTNIFSIAFFLAFAGIHLACIAVP